MHNTEIIFTLTGGLTTALLLGYLAQRVGWSPIVGYLFAGLVVGPYTPGYEVDRHLAEQLAEVGVILLMFGVGLHFHFKDLLAVRRIAVVGAVTQSLAATALGLGATQLMGWSWGSGLVFGLCLSVASTVVLTRVLSDNHELHTRTGRIAVGWLVVEDIFTVLVLLLLPSLAGPAAQGARGIGWALFVAVAKVAVLALFTFTIGGRVIAGLLSRVARTHSRELFTLSVLVLALGIAAGSAYFFGVSMALGAFLAGMVVGQSEFSFRAASEALPMRDAFAVLFFVSVGMLFNPANLLQSPLLLAMTLAIILIGKPLAALGLVAILGEGSRVGLGVAAALAQIGEFSFILAAMAYELKLLPPEANDLIILAAMVTITINPLVYSWVDPLERWLTRHRPLWAWLNRNLVRELAVTAPAETERPTAIIVGYGPIGETVARLLRERNIDPVVIELNLETVHRLRNEGARVVYGDASRPEVLQNAGAAAAVSLIVTAPASPESAELVRAVREINPGIHVMLRTHYLGEAAPMKRAGADEVFSGEGEVALEMTVALLHRLGATPEQMDKERQTVRRQLVGSVRNSDLPV